MKKIMQFIVGALLVTVLSASAVIVTSPNGHVQISTEIKSLLEPYPAGERLYYSVNYKNKPLLLDSPFRIDFLNMPSLATNLEITKSETRDLDSTWEPVWGTDAEIHDHCNELILTVHENQPPRRMFKLVFRAYNDGVAFRYEFPEQEAFSHFELTAEKNGFVFADDFTCWAGKYPDHRQHQETEYPQTNLGALQPGDVIACPLLIKTNTAWVALSEANLVDWAGVYFTGDPLNPNALLTDLSPRLDDPRVAVRSQAPRTSPWRTVLIGDAPGDLIESNLIVNLSDPLAIEDPSWIEPGISAWDRWWSGSYAPDFDGDLGVDNASMKYFIDFAAEMGWEYQLVDWTWYGPPFDPDQPFGAAGNPDADLTESIDAINIPELVEYGKKKGVKILVWLDWENADRQMDKAFPVYEKWGVAGVKVDFMARDDQEMVNFYHRLVKLAAKHHLTVDFHGSYKPTGFRRAYPNLLTREGVLGNEYNKWSDRITPTHNVTLPFTRMLCGPMDYTPGGFRNKLPETFTAVGNEAPGPFVMTTRAQQLAMMVVYESPLQVLCDSPYNYRMSPGGLDFLNVAPTTWDETKVLAGYPGQFVVIARKSGDEWYLGGMTNEEARDIAVSLDFLGQGAWTAHIWSDPDEAADYPDRIWYEEKSVKAGNTINLPMAGSGGIAVRFVKE